MEGHVDAVGVAGHGLVHGVIQNLADQMVEGALIRAADIHAGAAANGLKPFQNLDIRGAVRVFLGFLFRSEEVSHKINVFFSYG